ncbi:aminoacyl-tRNA hydrolase [uncultured Helicobacter sp.]|uniref:aminoacyl-tRNA hydrolase n=1 Tax=uncultured Helicobacter sp. TaxID=175537 RepID=UPI00262C020A|nr:aminoacyl-tRNA hydrolase [uncultured Helicobacter sp.]
MQPLLIVGLGNPERQYLNNRHNIGFMVLDALASNLSLTFKEDKNFKSYVAKNSELILCKPTTYMNLSGEAVLALKNYFRIEDVFVVHDDLDLPLGELKFKKGGGNGGHNGLKSIDKLCGSEYYRARCGIGRPESKELVASYVLGDFPTHPSDLITSCTQALETFISSRDFSLLQNQYTRKVKQ